MKLLTSLSAISIHLCCLWEAVCRTQAPHPWQYVVEEEVINDLGVWYAVFLQLVCYSLQHRQLTTRAATTKQH